MSLTERVLIGWFVAVTGFCVVVAVLDARDGEWGWFAVVAICAAINATFAVDIARGAQR